MQVVAIQVAVTLVAIQEETAVIQVVVDHLTAAQITLRQKVARTILQREATMMREQTDLLPKLQVKMPLQKQMAEMVKKMAMMTLVVHRKTKAHRKLKAIRIQNPLFGRTTK